VYFQDRKDAGRILARHLQSYKNQPNVLILALPRGGVPVAAEVARELNVPFDIFNVRKLGAPGHEELAMGAIATGGVRVLHEAVIRELGVPRHVIDAVTERERRELERREELYRGNRPAPRVEGRTIIVVDDGLATGSSMKAAVHALRQQKPERLIVAVPTAPAETCGQLRQIADDVVCHTTPEPFYAVGGSYADFRQTTDEEVHQLMSVKSGLISIPINGEEIQGDLHIPEHSGALVIFAHGSGSSRHSPRNKHVAEVLNDGGIGTLLVDLLTHDEEIVDRDTAQLRFDIDLLARRLSVVTNWIRGQSVTANMHLGYFGASTGAAAALVAAAKHPDVVEAIVSRGGRPDLAGPWLANVHTPVLLIVGGNDHMVIELNRQAASELDVEYRLEIVPGAGHLFEEPGALDHVALLAREWFEEYLILPNRHVA
jgi:putative phosphoribosyl transferase